VIIFFDRNTGTALPKALELLKLPVPVEYHQQHFQQDTPDDVWLSEVGKRGWTVIGNDYSFHRRPNELEAIRRYQTGVFYLWGANSPRWEIARVFLRAFEALQEIEATEAKPFVFRILKDARLQRVTLH
jgi:hypothetical protein